DVSATHYLPDVDLTVPTAIIMGAEGKGVSPAFLKMADEKVKIPMVGSFNSFNVSVATGIMLYEVVRQRLLAL
ncbi:MAG TPA: TrmH family RNA methyltransferase, partial [Chitinophagales bacterium]|nr:TrmH family RNA methyltransferase [Chitinophagales bacterium]